MYGVTSKGAIKTWECDVIDNGNDTATLAIKTRTKLDGKAVEREEFIDEGKNIGKANETTPYQQAINEAESRYRKKIKKGYGTEIPTNLTKADTNALGLPKPMLAHPLDKVKKVEFPAFFQPKFDGHRAIVTRLNGEIMMYSRGGDRITTMEHILDHLDDKVKEGEFLDGELYLHGELLQNIGSYIRKYREGISETIVYYIYDTMMDVPYTQRIDKLRITLKDAVPPVFLAPTQVVHSLAEAMELRNKVIAEGYEGGMLRTPDEGYRAGFKSRTLIKLKKFDDNEFKIVDVVEGKDRNVNGVFLKVACFVCEISPGGPRFEVTSMGDMHEKDKTWHDRESFMEKMLTVQHSGYTKELKPWHPVALQLREDI
jgi:DNA ligase-1